MPNIPDETEKLQSERTAIQKQYKVSFLPVISLGNLIPKKAGKSSLPKTPKFHSRITDLTATPNYSEEDKN